MSNYHSECVKRGWEKIYNRMDYINDGYTLSEAHHYDSNGVLRERDVTRQREIENELGCKFIRIWI